MRGHARRVALYAGLIADRLCLSAEDHEHVRIAAFLHDLGKVGVPTDLLLRAGALDANERHLVEQHPEIGARLIKPLDIPAAVSLSIRHHHEWWDGSGYHDGLAGEDIPLSARIISVADAFDAMSCDRPYRRALARQVITDEFKHFAAAVRPQSPRRSVPARRGRVTSTPSCSPRAWKETRSGTRAS
jgi:putative nucleotidyltransferase with HDIG domain